MSPVVVVVPQGRWSPCAVVVGLKLQISPYFAVGWGCGDVCPKPCHRTTVPCSQHNVGALPATPRRNFIFKACGKAEQSGNVFLHWCKVMT